MTIVAPPPELELEELEPHQFDELLVDELFHHHVELVLEPPPFPLK
jgi:hypothetical protein